MGNCDRPCARRNTRPYRTVALGSALSCLPDRRPAEIPASWTFSSGAAYRNRPDDLRITSVFPCVARRGKARASFMFIRCCWCRSRVVDGSSGTSRGHAPVVRWPGSQRCGAAERSPVFRPGLSQWQAPQNLPEVPGKTTSSKCSLIMGSGGSARLRRSRGLSAGVTSSR
jgi:hypothetical protein